MKNVSIMIVGLASLFLMSGQVFARQGISVNFDGAKIVYVDENYSLKKIDNHGNVSYVLNTDAKVSHIYYNSQSNLFLVFQSKQDFRDGNQYLLAKTVPTKNTISGIDKDMSAIAWDSTGLCPGVQSDSLGNLYYLSYSTGGGMALNKCVNGNGANIVNLINDNITITNFLVRPDGTVTCPHWRYQVLC